MNSQDTEKNRHSVGQFAALKTAIANGDEAEVKSRIGDSTMQNLQRSYLLDLAELSGNSHIIKIIENVEVSN